MMEKFTLDESGKIANKEHVENFCQTMQRYLIEQINEGSQVEFKTNEGNGDVLTLDRLANPESKKIVYRIEITVKR